MRTALYFPHTEIRSRQLLKTALLTWDQVELIAPVPRYRGHYPDRAMAEAVEIIGVPREPSNDHKYQVHLLLEDLLARGVPETFRYRIDLPHDDYVMWPQKLLHETWSMLRDHRLIMELSDNGDYHASRAAGLTIMSMLADVMAGTTRARITDRGLAYAALANLPGVEQRPGAAGLDVDRIVPLTFKSISLDAIELETLIAFRKREAKASGHNHRRLRHLYLDTLEQHLEEVANLAPGSDDREEQDRVFAQKLEDDLVDLKEELGLARKDALLSKDTLTFVLASAGTVAAAAAAAATIGPFAIPAAFMTGGTPVAIGGMLSTTNKYAAKRREILRKHPMAYLYELGA